jgi:hypothetical protein
MGGVPKGVPIDPTKAPPMTMAPPIIGGPQTVLTQFQHIGEVTGAGRIEIIVIGAESRFPHETVVSSLKLMGQTIVPAMHADTFTLS